MTNMPAAKKAPSFSFTGTEFTTRARAPGWDGNANAENCSISINCCVDNTDSFPVKIGDLSILSQVRFVITLDSDTELPRGISAAHDRNFGASSQPGDH